ncbi:hypothetical protein [Novipirellula caenicola]|uniref:Uncharacterized protein n=1 Tax=Novipirellula caenicola TaxID=1536901 RepID=A0ABP9VZI7_9BACT
MSSPHSSSPYLPPPLPHRPVVHRALGWATRIIAGAFAVLFAGIMVMTAYQLRMMILYGAGVSGPVPLVIATGFQLTILAVIIAMLWRLSNHFLYPNTHGFGICDRQNAAHLLAYHANLDLSQASLPDPLYAPLRLRELLLIYTLMDRQEHPDRLLALLATMKAHPDLQDYLAEQNNPASQQRPEVQERAEFHGQAETNEPAPHRGASQSPAG